MFVEDKAKGYE